MALPITAASCLPCWRSFGFFDDASKGCVAVAEATRLAVILDGRRSAVAGIRNVAVAKASRGRGLASALVARVLDWADRTALPATLLYTEEPGIYTRAGFRQQMVEVFEGSLPSRLGRNIGARPFDLVVEEARLLDLLARRTPVSLTCSIVDAPGLFLASLPERASWSVAFLEPCDALVVFREEEGSLTIIDIVAVQIPPLATIAGALIGSGLVSRDVAGVTTLFCPDRLAWSAAPRSTDSGLMIARRGAFPADRLSFPPTAEF